MTSVVVVGLLPKQASDISREFKNRLKLDFVRSQGKTARLPRADECVLLIKFVKHVWTDHAFSVFRRDRIHYVMGGLTELRQKLGEIASGVAIATHHRGIRERRRF